jgi:hypothetical protein
MRGQLVLQSPLCGFVYLFTLSGMAAAAVRPVQRPKPFAASALLQKQLTIGIEQEYGKCTMQDAITIVTFAFAQAAPLPIAFVDEYQELLLGGNDFLRTIAH